MYFTIKKISPIAYLDKDKNLVVFNGYAFLDECSRCIIIAYGENRRDVIADYLKSDVRDTLGLKYRYIDLNKPL